MSVAPEPFVCPESLTPQAGQITRFSWTIFLRHVRQIRKHDVSPKGDDSEGYRAASQRVFYSFSFVKKEETEIKKEKRAKECASQDEWRRALVGEAKEGRRMGSEDQEERYMTELGGLLPLRNDETDGLLRDGKRCAMFIAGKKKMGETRDVQTTQIYYIQNRSIVHETSVPQEGGGEQEALVDEVRPLLARDKTHFASGPSDFITREHTYCTDQRTPITLFLSLNLSFLSIHSHINIYDYVYLCVVENQPQGPKAR